MKHLMPAVITLAALAAPANPCRAAPRERVIYDFHGQKEGGVPWATPLLYKGNLFCTYTGELRQDITDGGVVELTPETGKSWSNSIIERFSNEFDSPEYSAVIADAHGNLFGSTYESVYELSPPANGQTNWAIQLIYKIPANSAGYGGVIFDAAGNLYGTGVTGGPNNAGFVFELTPPAGKKKTWQETTLYNFAGGADGANPFSPLVFDASGNLFGTTYAGGGGTLCSAADGQGCGTVYKLTPPAQGQTNWTETVLYAFTGGADGGNPMGASLTLDSAGNVYGTAPYTQGVTNTEGVAFELSPPSEGQATWTYSVLHTFAVGQNLIGDGYLPESGMIFDQAGNLFGTTEGGGAFAKGTVFELSPPANGQTAWSETIYYSFGRRRHDACNPIGGLVMEKSGRIFGTGSACGRRSDGAVFEIRP